jgi:demethylmenaquinone methyltransferase/2-methoxy-6-polyprenyl-1,4-benzoquinol methylase
VGETEKTGEGREKPLHAMFSRVPPSYDRVNTVVTFGMDVRWRRSAAREILSGPSARVLDLCCGTGDLALELAGLSGGDREIVGADFSAPMLEIARKKAAERGLKVDFLHADAANLPFADGRFDCVGISFGFRNLTWQNPRRDLFLAEILRVLAPGGRFVTVESSQPRYEPIRSLYRLYMRAIVAGVGGAISGERSAYRYLGDSAARFYDPAGVEKMLLEAGFASVKHRSMLLGGVGLYTATKAPKT